MRILQSFTKNIVVFKLAGQPAQATSRIQGEPNVQTAQLLLPLPSGASET